MDPKKKLRTAADSENDMQDKAVDEATRERIGLYHIRDTSAGAIYNSSLSASGKGTGHHTHYRPEETGNDDRAPGIAQTDCGS